MPNNTSVKKKLPENANLENLRKQAKRFRKDVLSGDSIAISRLVEFLPRILQKNPPAADVAATTLSDAQLVVAREYGFSSWPALKKAIEARHIPASEETEQNNTGNLEAGQIEVPLVPMGDFVLFPGTEIPIGIGRAKSLSAVEAAGYSNPIFLLTQLDSNVRDTAPEDMFNVGTLATILRVHQNRDGSTRVLVRGDNRARVVKIDFSGLYGTAIVEVLAEPVAHVAQKQISKAKSLALKIAGHISSASTLVSTLEDLSEPGRLAGLTAQYLNLSFQKKQMLLEMNDPEERFEFLIVELEKLLDQLEHPPINDFVGYYQLAPGFVVKVSNEKETLVAKSPWDRYPLSPRGDDAFFPQPSTSDKPSSTSLQEALWPNGAPLSYKFDRDNEGNVSQLSRLDGIFRWPDGQKLAKKSQSKSAIEWNNEALLRYQGSYENSADDPVVHPSVITVESEQLSLNSKALQSVSETEFLSKTEPLRVSFKMNQSQAVIGMQVFSPKSSRQYWKVD